MLSVGDRVTCTYRGSHVGEVLDVLDDRAWRKDWSRGQREEYLAQFGRTATPVLWPWGVMLDTTKDLHPVGC